MGDLRLVHSMTELIDWVQQNGWFILGAQYVWSCFVQSLPDPTTQDPRLYVFIFRFAHALAGNTNVIRKPLKGSI